jgi:hypothetical protein
MPQATVATKKKSVEDKKRKKLVRYHRSELLVSDLDVDVISIGGRETAPGGRPPAARRGS